MPRLKGPEKAQIRLRVRREVADEATEKGAAWLQGVLESALGGQYRDIELPDDHWAYLAAEGEQMGLSVSGMIRLAVRKMQLELESARLNHQPPLMIAPRGFPADSGPALADGAKPGSLQGYVAAVPQKKNPPKPSASAEGDKGDEITGGPWFDEASAIPGSVIANVFPHRPQVGPAANVPGSRLKKVKGG